MTKVRPGKDIVVFTKNGIDWVASGSGGVSTFSKKGAGKNWWKLDAGYVYPDELVVVNDHDNHFSWEPRIDMPLSDFIDHLASVQSSYYKIN